MVNTSGQGCLDTLSGVVMSFVLFVFAVSVLLLIALLFVGAITLFLILRFLFRHYALPQFYPATAVFAEQRLFGAPPDSQLFSAFDYWLRCLEEATGLTFTETPGQLLFGSILIALAPALVIGLPLALIVPNTGNSLLPLFILAGVLFGSFTGHRLGQPAQGWFQVLGTGSNAIDDEHQGGFTLGDEDW